MPYRVILICLLMGAYLLTANDRLQSADGYAILATAQSGTINIMGAVDYLIIPKGRMGTFGLDGDLYSKKGITPSIALLPLVWINSLLPNAPLQATAHLFNGVVSVATALVLFGFIIRLGYDKRVAFIVALLLGVGTLYLVYARTLFGEPLAGLLVLVAITLLHPYPHSPLSPLHGEGGDNSPHKIDLTSFSHYGVGIFLGILLGLLAGINLTYIAFVPIFALYQFFITRRLRDVIITGIGFILTAGIMVGALNLSRYGALTETGYKFGAGEGFSTPLLTGLYGLFFSPWRGIMWYMPLCWLMPVGWWLFSKKHRPLAWLIVVCIGVQSVIYALWWSWHGGVVWGARFLVPIIPIAMIVLAPVVQWVFFKKSNAIQRETSPLNPLSTMERGLQTPYKDDFLPLLQTREGGRGDEVKKIYLPLTRWIVAILITALFIASIGLQLLGTLYDFNTHEGVLYASHEEKLANALMFHPELSAINANLTALSHNNPIDWSWAKNGDRLGLIVALGVIAWGFLAGLIRHRLMPRLALIVVCVGMGIFAMRGESGSVRENRQALQTALSPSAPIIATTDDTTFINLRGFGDISTIYAPTSPDEPFTRQLWDNATDETGLRWFVTWFNPANPENWAERDLFTRHAFVKEVWAGGYRSVLFYLHPPAPQMIDTTWQFGDNVRLNGYGMSSDDNGLFITLDWGFITPLPANWGWFVHVLDANGDIIAQQDRIPLGGFADNTANSATERLFFISPENAVSVRIGWTSGGALIPVAGVSDGFIVLPIAN